MSGRTVTLVIEGVEGTDFLEALSAWPVGSISCTEGDVPAALRKRVAELEALRADDQRMLGEQIAKRAEAEAKLDTALRAICEAGGSRDTEVHKTNARVRWGIDVANRLYPGDNEGT